MAGSREGLRLGTYQVSRAMHEAATALKRRGARVFVTAPGALPDGVRDGGVCPNCGGVGTLYLEYITGGPFDGPPAHNPGIDNDGKRTGPSVHPAYFPNEEKWYSLTMNGYPCVVCMGATITTRFEQERELAL